MPEKETEPAQPQQPPPPLHVETNQQNPQCSQPADIFRAKTEDLGEKDD